MASMTAQFLLRHKEKQFKFRRSQDVILWLKVKVKGAMPLRSVGGVLISLSVAVEPVYRWIDH